MTTEEAFVSAASHSFRGKPLHPFSFHRQIAACRVATALGMGGGMEGALLEPVVVVWLCTLDNKGTAPWTVRKAIAEPLAALEEVIEFADANGIGMGSGTFLEAKAINDAIIEEIKASKGEPLTPGGEKEDAPGEL